MKSVYSLCYCVALPLSVRFPTSPHMARGHDAAWVPAPASVFVVIGESCVVCFMIGLPLCLCCVLLPLFLHVARTRALTHGPSQTFLWSATQALTVV